jgi:hypothetical protein
MRLRAHAARLRKQAADAASHFPDGRPRKSRQSAIRSPLVMRHIRGEHSRGLPTGSEPVLRAVAPSHARSRCHTCCGRFAGAGPPRRTSQWRKPCAKTRPKRKARTPRAISTSTRSLPPVSTAILKRLARREEPLTRFAMAGVLRCAGGSGSCKIQNSHPSSRGCLTSFGEPLNKEAG